MKINKSILYVLALVLLTLFIKYVVMAPIKKIPRPQSQNSHSNINSTSTDNPAGTDSHQPLPPSADTQAGSAEKPPFANPWMEFEAAQKKKSEESFTNFTNAARINLKLNENYKYTEVDLDAEDIIVLHGHNNTLTEKVSMFASTKSPSEDELRGFINENKALIPGFPENIPNMNMMSLPSEKIQQKGLASAKVWHGTDGQNFFAVVYMIRRDGQGSYMFTLSGPKSQFQNNDGYFDNLLANFHAK